MHRVLCLPGARSAQSHKQRLHLMLPVLSLPARVNRGMSSLPGTRACPGSRAAAPGLQAVHGMALLPGADPKGDLPALLLHVRWW